jgi:hypothetical protein
MVYCNAKDVMVAFERDHYFGVAHYTYILSILSPRSLSYPIQLEKLEVPALLPCCRFSMRVAERPSP